jgi:hypothetical protein
MVTRSNIITNINFRSDRNGINGKKSHMIMYFKEPILLPKDGKRSQIALIHAKIPNTKYNITAALGNNTIRYSINDGADYHVITFLDGIYSVYDVDNYIQTELYKNGHYELDTITNLPIFPFSLEVNESSSKGYLNIHDTYSAHPDIIVDLGNNNTSTFYLLHGFTNAQKILDADVADQVISANNVDIFDSYIRIEMNIVESYEVLEESKTDKEMVSRGNTLWQGNFQGVRGSFFLLTKQNGITGLMIDE